MNILIGTPCYGGKLDLDYLNSIIDCHRNRIPFSVMGIRNESLITRGRNTIFSYFLHLKQFSHLLFLDADIGIAGEDIIRLMSYGKDVIGAPVRLKGLDNEGKPAYNVYPKPTASESINLLQSVDRIGTAVFCLSRLACERLAAVSETYEPSNLTRGQVVGMDKHYDVFRCGVKNGVYLSEDYWACQTLLDLGIPIYADWGIRTKHWGIESYE